MNKLSIGTLLDEIKEEIKHAPKMYHQLERRDELIRELRAENAILKDRLKEITDQEGYATLAWDVETTKLKREENWKRQKEKRNEEIRNITCVDDSEPGCLPTELA